MQIEGDPARTADGTLLIGPPELMREYGRRLRIEERLALEGVEITFADSAFAWFKRQKEDKSASSRTVAI